MTIHLNQGHVAAIVLALGLIFWMAAGSLSPEQPLPNPRPLVPDHGPQRVQAERLQGSLIQRTVSFSGHTAANRRVELRAEIRGTVIAVHRQKGSQVKRGDLLLELDSRDWPARVQQAEANLKQRRLEARSARELAQKGLANEAQLAQADTLLANAEAELTNARIQLGATRIRAPFDGVVDQRLVEIGDFVREGDALAVMLDFSPWLVTGQVAERDAADIRIGAPAWAELVNGERVEGLIRFISAEADASTRTFTVEMEVQQHDAAISSGLTARIQVPQPETWAYPVSPALLVLNDQGHLGLKGVDERSRVVFLPVNLLKADNKGIWVYGPEADTRIITVGQGFVEYGQTVEAVYPETRSAVSDTGGTAVLSAE